MRRTILLFASLVQLSSIASAQDGTAEKPNEQPASGSALPGNSQEALEAKFKETLTQATMTGRWCLLKDGTLGPEREDKYTIVGVTKVGGDSWIINARIQYGARDVVAPIPVQVKWAGDAPVITVDKLPIPGGGTYTARVLIFEGTYAGSWSGGGRTGLLNGVITTQKPTTTPASP